MIRAKRGMKVQLSKRGSSGRSGAFSVLVSHRKIVFFLGRKCLKPLLSIHVVLYVFTREIHRVTDRRTDPTQAHWGWVVQNKMFLLFNFWKKQQQKKQKYSHATNTFKPSNKECESLTILSYPHEYFMLFTIVANIFLHVRDSILLIL